MPAPVTPTPSGLPLTSQPAIDPMKTLGDRRWRLNNLFKCRREGDGMAMPFRPRDEQKMVFEHLITKPRIPLYIIKSRRLGISTGICNFQSERCTFSSGYRGFIIDQSKDDAVKKMTEMVRFAIKNLPQEILTGFIIDKENDSEFRMHAVNEKDTQGSAIEAAISGRGGDISFLHCSELGPIASLDPARAREIRTGAFPAARKGSRVVETTWYGGKTGELWEMVRPILDGDPNADGVVMFFPWHGDPQAVRMEGTVTSEMEQYFIELAEKVGKTFTQEQKRWYCAERVRLGMWVKREVPSTLDEALSVPMAGSIFGAWLDDLRQKRRIHDFAADRTVCGFTFWDIGFSDFGCIWLLQFVGRDILVLDYISGEGEEASFYANVTKKWEDKHDIVIRRHYLPHDADTRERSSGKSYKDALIVAGLRAKEITVVPRTPDIWLGINELRSLLTRFFIHSTNCSQKFFKKGEIKREGAETIPSGIDCLDFYRKREGSNNGVMYEEPVHDKFSHGASALRTMSEASRQAMLEGSSAVARENRAHPVRVLRGAGPDSYPAGLARRGPNVIR